jgi:hypothetical protein
MSEEKKPPDNVIPFRQSCDLCGGDGCPTCNGTGYITLSAYGDDRKQPAKFKVKRGKNVKKRMAGVKPWSTLVGKFFHTFTQDLPRKGRGQVQNQGVILLDLGNGCFLVQLFDFLMGAPSSRHVVHIERIVANGWAFYETDAEMRDCYKHYVPASRFRES